jgi:Zn-dependent protease with chaperone function
MNPAPLLTLVLLATFGLVGVVLSGLLALLWRAGLRLRGATSVDLLGLRLLPSAGSALIALTVALPAFLTYEPHREHEAAGPLLLALAAFAVACLAHGLWRGWRACAAAHSLLRHCLREARPGGDSGAQLQVVDVAEPLVALIGAWRPRIVASESVRAACNPEEFREVLAHEAAHCATWDNLRLLMLVAAPDVVAWTRLEALLTARWRAAAEREADQRATGGDPERRLALASALIKVARLVNRGDGPLPALGMSVAVDDVSGRVRRLLEPPARAARARLLPLLAGCGLLIPLLAWPCHAGLHELLEQLVRFGR